MDFKMPYDQFLVLLTIFSEALFPESQLADMVVNDHNLSNENIDFNLKYLDENTHEFIKNNSDATTERAEMVNNVLVWLREVPEDYRDSYMDWLHTPVEVE